MVLGGCGSGGTGPDARPPITGAPAVAQQLLARGTRFAPHARPAIVNGMLFVNSGYGQWGGMPGNVLLVFSVDGK